MGAGGGGGEVEDLADVEGFGVDARVGGFEGLEGDVVVLSDGEEGVSGCYFVSHFGEVRFEDVGVMKGVNMCCAVFSMMCDGLGQGR